jgi:hypothetical protein
MYLKVEVCSTVVDARHLRGNDVRDVLAMQAIIILVDLSEACGYKSVVRDKLSKIRKSAASVDPHSKLICRDSLEYTYALYPKYLGCSMGFSNLLHSHA